MELTPNTVVVVTGAASGIGRALARGLLARATRVVAVDRDDEGLSELARECGSERLHCRTLDVTDRAAVHALAEAVETEFGGIDAWINNAGVALAETVADLDYPDFEWLMQINFWGMVYGAKAALPGMRRRRRGSIVFLSSVLGLIGAPTQSAYCASKFGIRGFAEALRQEVAEDGVEVVVVCPGGVRTNIIRNARIRTWTDEIPGFRGDPVTDFERVARTRPEQAAEAVIKGIERGRPRVLIGADGRWIDRLQRLVPGAYPSIYRWLIGRWARESG